MPSTTWMSLENIVLCEKNQSESTTHFRVHAQEKYKTGKFIEPELSLVVARAGGVGDNGDDC